MRPEQLDMGKPEVMRQRNERAVELGVQPPVGACDCAFRGFHFADLEQRHAAGDPVDRHKALEARLVEVGLVPREGRLAPERVQGKLPIECAWLLGGDVQHPRHVLGLARDQCTACSPEAGSRAQPGCRRRIISHGDEVLCGKRMLPKAEGCKPCDPVSLGNLRANAGGDGICNQQCGG